MSEQNPNDMNDIDWVDDDPKCYVCKESMDKVVALVHTSCVTPAPVAPEGALEALRRIELITHETVGFRRGDKAQLSEIALIAHEAALNTTQHKVASEQGPLAAFKHVRSYLIDNFLEDATEESDELAVRMQALEDALASPVAERRCDGNRHTFFEDYNSCKCGRIASLTVKFSTPQASEPFDFAKSLIPCGHFTHGELDHHAVKCPKCGDEFGNY